MLIGVSGKIGSGKDTVGEIVQIISASPHFTDEAVLSFIGRQHLNSIWEIKKFADKLKNIVCMLLGCTREQLENQEFKNTQLGEEWWYFQGRNGSLMSYNKDSKRSDEDLIKTTPRLLLQIIGTECIRDKVHPNAWVNALMSEYKFSVKPGTPDFPNWIITDMRFPNELKAVKDRDGITIRVNRETQADRFAKIDTDKFHEYPRQEHESETALDNAEFDYVIENDGTLLELINKVREILTLINSTNEPN